MALISYVCVALAAWYVWRWLRTSPDKIPMDSRFPWLALGVIGAVGIACYLPTWRIDQAAARASRAVSALMGEPLEYRCGSMLNVFFDRDTDMAMGYVAWTEHGPAKWSKLRHETCDGLLQFLQSPDDLRTHRRTKVQAIHILSHEARHMLGEHVEQRADCQALQRNAQLARALGASEAAARELAVAYWTEVYQHQSSMYFSGDCRKGGALDEKLPGAPWG